ncbi:M23 family metallopeptidase [Microbacterium immunditiarum]|uniref:Murein DD-endopeptidase MepM/ murein hydrolase activator NlpD n=1 Tax=Microbacterium immunditiarum TaxID=337480 RepID=A0A7Y9GPY6_9MICO|nr:M23 family metallopeptidase [Microbacterium immunditiarum]NYE20507.1 murein DD-endopeptidase MepM/ murein hydrolase activator NlpD [Microbacterium immunditiarum]
MTRYPHGGTTAPIVASPYGPRRGGAFSFHYGTDFVGYDELKSVLPGTVTHAGWLNSAAGNAIVVDSRDPLSGRTVTVCRFHVGAIAVRKGQTVLEGQTLGRMGFTGNATGPCDHVEIRYWAGGAYTTENPTEWFAARVRPPSSAGGGAQPVVPTPKPPEQEDDPMARIFTKPKDGSTVYELKDGRKRGITNVEWTVIKAAYAAAGEKVPYARNVVTAADLARIPDA